MRVLGGSMGIAASTAILGIKQRKELFGIVTEEQLTNLQEAARSFTIEQLHAVRQAYSDAFNEDMRVSAIIAGVCILVTLGTFRRNTQPILERRLDQGDETERGNNLYHLKKPNVLLQLLIPQLYPHLSVYCKR
jgi:hypothetical protein